MWTLGLVLRLGGAFLLLTGCSASITVDGVDAVEAMTPVPTAIPDSVGSMEEATSQPVPTVASEPETVSDAADSPTWTQLGAAIEGEAADDRSGGAVALSADGSRVAIGAALAVGSDGASTGHVRVFDWDGAAWVQVGGDIDGEASGDLSGAAVALSADGSRLAIGAPRNAGGTHSAGHVRVFDWDGAAWVQVGGDIDGEASADLSGAVVALSADGSRVAIGSRFNGVRTFGAPSSGEQSGNVRVFDWDGAGWVQVGADIDGAVDDDEREWSVALSADGSRIAVGAHLGNGVDKGQGHVRLFDWDGAAWVQVGAAIEGDAPVDQSLALSADGSRVAIGAPATSENARISGQVRVFDWNGTDWIQRGPGINGEGAFDGSGESVALSADGSRVAIGATWNGFRAGHVRVFDWDGTGWVQVGLDIDGVVSEDQSAWVALSADGSRVAVGAPLNDGNGVDSGHVRVFATESSNS